MPFKIMKKSNLKQQCLVKTKKARKANAYKVATKAAIRVPQNDLAPELTIEWRSPDLLEPPKRQVRKAAPEHINRAIKSITTYGMVSPITVRGSVVIDGHTRLAACKELKMETVPCIDVGHLSEEQARALAISLNRLAEHGEWDLDELKIELDELEVAGIDLAVTFFSDQELDIIRFDGNAEDPSDEEAVPEPEAVVISQPGDLWVIADRHRILCGDALELACYEILLGGTVADAVLTDSPYNVNIAGNVSGLGAKKHGEFKMASGEMSREEFHAFLRTAHQNCADNMRKGGVVYSFIDWRSHGTLVAAAEEAGLRHINTAVWYKGTGGMGGFLRSAHEFCAIFCKGDKPIVNNVELGRHGRDRTNVWVYPGANTPGSSGAEALKNHPTPKNVEMCMDAMLDVTVRGDLVLDPFAGSGTTMVAAERTGRLCFAIELDPAYVDVCVRRLQALTGEEAALDETGQTFSEVALERQGQFEGKID